MSHTKKCSMSSCRVPALVLVVIGALNWGLVGIGIFAGINLNVVNLILGGVAWLEAIVYLLVALSGIYLAFAGCCCSKSCKDDACCKDGTCCADDDEKSAEALSMDRPGAMPDADGGDE